MEEQKDTGNFSDYEDEPNKPTQSQKAFFKTVSNSTFQIGLPGQKGQQPTDRFRVTTPLLSAFGTPTASHVKLNSNSTRNVRLATNNSSRSDLSTDKILSTKNSSAILRVRQWQSKEETDGIIRNLSEKVTQIGWQENATSSSKLTFEEYVRKRLALTEQLRGLFATSSQNSEELQNYFTRSYEYLHSSDLSFTMEELHTSENLRLKQFKKSVYYGEVQNNCCSGAGIMIYHSGRLYEGYWQNDLKFGKGYELFSNGNVYIGSFVNGRPEGYGTYIWANGEVYDGQWLNGMKHGKGAWMGSDKDSYSGDWKFGKPDGKGVHKWINGDVYQGEFRSCLKHGNGQEKFSNGDVYIGQYSNGRPEGEGEYLWGDGAYYKGQFLNGLRHGAGVWRKRKEAQVTDIFEGEYQNDKRQGFGVFTWASGNVYKGEYQEDLRHGNGEMNWVDQSSYKGQWEKGIQSGYGELYTVRDGTRKGLFENNVFKGDGDLNASSSGIKSMLDETVRHSSVFQNMGKKRQYASSKSPVMEENSPTKSTSSRLNNHHHSGEKQLTNRSEYSRRGAGGNSGGRQYTGATGRSLSTTTASGDMFNGGIVAKKGRSFSNVTQSTFAPSISGQQQRNNRDRSLQQQSQQLVQLVSRKPRQFVIKKSREILLKKHEIVLWQGMRDRLGIKARELRDYTDQNTVEIIRGYLHPPVWKPAGVKVQTSPEREGNSFRITQRGKLF